MKNRHYVLPVVAVVGLTVLLLTGCGKDGDGKLEMKEPRKELSEMPERKNWSVKDAEGFGE